MSEQKRSNLLGICPLCKKEKALNDRKRISDHFGCPAGMKPVRIIYNDDKK